MAHQVQWTKRIVDEFVREGMLTKEEENVIRTRAAGWTRTKQCMEFGFTEATLDRIIAKLKIKYDAVADYDPVLPKRKI